LEPEVDFSSTASIEGKCCPILQYPETSRNRSPSGERLKIRLALECIYFLFSLFILLKCHPEFEPDVVALNAVFYFDLWKPLDLCHEVFLPACSTETRY
jgi:hypothetical protein